MAKRKKLDVGVNIPTPENAVVPTKSRRRKKDNGPSVKQLQAELDATQHLLETTKEQLTNVAHAYDALVADYTRITNYILKSLNVFYESTLMAFKEDKK